MTSEFFRVGYEIPEFTNVVWSGPKPVKHYVLRGDGNPGKSATASIYIYKEELTDPSLRAESLEEASQIASDLWNKGSTYPDKPDYDLTLEVLEQSWVILELDRADGWRFSTSHPAVTTKVADEPFTPPGQDKKKYGFNGNLRYVTLNGVVKRFEELEAADESQMVLFRVIYRKRHKGRGMNFLVDLMTDKVPGGHRIPIIIDPDVPDDGTEGFPNPP
ncbi:MAG: nucleotide synthetase [Pseudomonadota bacterium]